MDRLIGIHAVTAAFEAERPIDRLLVAKGSGGPRLQQLIDAARRGGVPVRFEARALLDREAHGGVHQGVVAFASERGTVDLDAILAEAAPDALLVVTDGLEDPHNLGAVIRSSHAAGATALLIPERRSAGLTETVAKASAGAIEFLPVVRVKNVNRALDELKKAGFWIFGLDERGEQTIYEEDFSGKVALVLGAEGKGLHRLTSEKCDKLVRIPMTGRIASLNVSVAAGVALFEIVRRRR
ncbi:MAG: 23S rRNA (guanosine(2251)-2'-O)-methyltransferase RlmB [Acidobacteria bacterium]|nr:23S rRNA (guanosine(2251)-2'-O)-methyltransferase RlmB [Acidobacteriota bacterium]